MICPGKSQKIFCNLAIFGVEATARQVHFSRSSEVMNDWVSSGLGRLGGGEEIGFGLRGWGMGDGRGLNDGR